MLRKGYVALLAFVVALGAVGAWAVFDMAGSPKAEARATPSRASRLVRGDTTSAFIKAFDAAVPFREKAVALFASLRYDVFGEGYPGVLVGGDGWLFTTEELEPALSSGNGYLDGPAVDALASARDELAERGIALVVALVPAKARVYADRLAGYALPDAIESRYGGALALLDGLSIATIDLSAAFGAERAEGPGPELFQRADTHWTPAGAAVAARAIAAGLGRLSVDLPAMRVEAASAPAAEREGDLMAYLPRRGTTRRPLPPPESLPGYDTFVDSGAGLFGAQEIPVALVGTSYSAEPAWHFDGFLKRELGTDVINLASSGEGPFKPMADAIAGGELERNGVRLVVWEMPERYFDVEPRR